MGRVRSGAAPGQGSEIEIKLALPSGCSDRLRRQLAAVPALARQAPVQQVHNLYYDTPDQALRRQRAALRIRRVDGEGGSQWLQTLKTADKGLSALSQRGEWEVPVGGPALHHQALCGAPRGGVWTRMVRCLLPWSLVFPPTSSAPAGPCGCVVAPPSRWRWMWA